MQEAFMYGQGTLAALRGLEQAARLRLTSTEYELLSALAAHTVELPRRRKLIEHGQCYEQIFLINSGWLFTYKQLRDGGRQILSFSFPGDFVGMESIAFRAALHSTASLTRCSVSPVSRQTFMRIQEESPRIAAAIFLMTLRNSAIMEEWAVSLGRRSGVSRVAHLLLELAARLRMRGLCSGNAVPFPVTQQDIADCTGLTACYVNQILRRMQHRRQIDLEGRRLHIRSVAELAKLSGFKPEYLQLSATPKRSKHVDGHAGGRDHRGGQGFSIFSEIGFMPEPPGNSWR
jgi:CRP-like cAMP-binding protein